MNLWSGCLGGIPMCHGAGGMAAHVRFGARTGGAPIILGVLLIVVGLTRGPSVQTLLGLFPPAVLGVILFLTGAQLALGGSDFGATRAERFVTLVTAAIATWNVAAGFVAGSLLLWASARGSARL
jgi:MFS superfamily sulfate permease-like transporter